MDKDERSGKRIDPVEKKHTLHMNRQVQRYIHV